MKRRQDGSPAKLAVDGDLPPDVLLETERPVRVYADGIYDLFHFGHARSLEQAKRSFPNTYLLVGCCNDEITQRYKGKTVMTEAERYESLRHCKWVDEVIPDAPWIITQEFIDKHKIDYVAHDSLPYADASGMGKDVYEFIKAIGKFKETKRTDGISTSDVIMRILKDYNLYVMRNLARGYTRKDLGVSYVKEKQLRVNMGITKLRKKVEEHQKKLHTVAKTAGVLHKEWLENADRWVAGFLEKFEEGCHIMYHLHRLMEVCSPFPNFVIIDAATLHFNVGEDSVFDGIFELFLAFAGGSIGVEVNDADIRLNWASRVFIISKIVRPQASVT